MIIRSMTTRTSKGHLNLFKSINKAPQEERGEDKKVFMKLHRLYRACNEGMDYFHKHASLVTKNNNSFHVAIHSVNHDNKIQCFIYSNWSIFMSFEWQSAQFGVHQDPKSFNWQTKSQSQALVEHRWKSVAMNATKSTSMLTPFLHICHVF